MYLIRQVPRMTVTDLITGTKVCSSRNKYIAPTILLEVFLTKVLIDSITYVSPIDMGRMSFTSCRK